MKTLYLSIVFLFTSIIAYSQHCLIGDCSNGYAILQQADGSYRQGFFVDGRPIGMETIMGNGFMLINVFEPEAMFTSRFGMYKKGKDIVITNNSKHYGLEFNLGKRIFNKIYLSDDNVKTKSRVALKNNNLNKGCVVGNCENGFGVYIYDDGVSYVVGEWLNGKRNGIVYLYNKSGTYYGEYKMGKRHGYGTYVWNNNSFYSGNWANGNMEGKGVYHINSKRFSAGIFKNGKISKIITTTEKPSKEENNTSSNNSMDRIKKVFQNKINECTNVSCLTNIFNSIAKINADIEDKASGERFTGDILKMMDAYKDGVLVQVYFGAKDEFRKHFIAAAKYLPKEIREEIVSNTKEIINKNKQ